MSKEPIKREQPTREELLEKIDDLTYMIIKNYMEKNSKSDDEWNITLISLLLERASHYLDLGEQVYAVVDFEIAVQLQTEFKISVESLCLLVVSLFETFCRLNWVDEASRWRLQIEDLLKSIDVSHSKEAEDRKNEWFKVFTDICERNKTVLIPDQESDEVMKKIKEQAGAEAKKYNKGLDEELKDDLRKKIINDLLYQRKLMSYKGKVGILNDVFTRKANKLKRYSCDKVRVFNSPHGIGLKAKFNLKKGTLIFKDKPIIRCFDKNHCCWCGEKFSKTYLDCGCGERYCSRKCKVSAWKDHHSFEHLIFGDRVLKFKEKEEDKEVKFLMHLKIQAWEMLDVSTIVMGPLFVKFVSKFCKDKDYPEADPFSMHPFDKLHIGNYTKIKSYDEKTNILKDFDISSSNLYRHYQNFRLLLTHGHNWCKFPYINFHKFLKFTKMAFNNLFCNIKYGHCVIFEKISLLNHSCMPNVGVVFKKGEGHVVALRNIRKGEELRYSYVNPTSHVVERQKTFHMFGFCCTCKKCILEVKRGLKKKK